MIEQELFEILKESFDIDTTQFDKTTKLREHLDSIDFLGFLMQVRKKYKIDIEADSIKNIHTIEDVTELIQKHNG